MKFLPTLLSGKENSECELNPIPYLLYTYLMVSITHTSTGTMVKRVPPEQMFVIEATLLENHFLPSSGFVMLMSVEDVLIS